MHRHPLSSIRMKFEFDVSLLFFISSSIQFNHDNELLVFRGYAHVMYCMVSRIYQKLDLIAGSFASPALISFSIVSLEFICMEIHKNMKENEFDTCSNSLKEASIV